MEGNNFKLHICNLKLFCHFWVQLYNRYVYNPRNISVFVEDKMWALAMFALPDINDMPGQKDIETAEKPN